MDKSESFKNLQNELNISIPEASNPLTDSLIVSVKGAELMNGVQEIIEAREEVKEVYKDEPYLKQSQEQSYIIYIAQIGSAIFSFLIALVTIVIFNLGVAIEFLNNANTGLDYRENIKNSKLKNLIPFSMSSIVATLIFFNIYVFFRKYVTNANFDSSLLSLKEIFLWHIGAIGILNFLVWLIPANLGRIEYEEENDDDLEYEFYEDDDKKDEFYDEFEDYDI
jgi:cell division protein ftsX